MPNPPNPPSRTGVKPAQTARERLQARKKSAEPAKPTPRPPNPTRSVEPGTIHYRIAEGILKGVQQRANEAGISLDVGEFPASGQVGVSDDDPQKVVKLTAHAIARIGDKFTFLRKVSRHLEGQDKRAGLLSDVVAALTAIYQRNPEVIENLSKQMVSEVQANMANRKAQTNGGANVPPDPRRVAPNA